ncbi:MAG: hypothetical protein ACFFG0_18560 [Candidatus Thorarchaeota archaeon]
MREINELLEIWDNQIGTKDKRIRVKLQRLITWEIKKPFWTLKAKIDKLKKKTEIKLYREFIDILNSFILKIRKDQYLITCSPSEVLRAIREYKERLGAI